MFIYLCFVYSRLNDHINNTIAMKFSKEVTERIASEIHSDESPVGIDAKKTHILILAQLEKMQSDIEIIKNHLNIQ